MALEAGIDVLHHAHGITKELIEKAAAQNTAIVATPMGGTHLEPNSPENILALVRKTIPVSIATDSYLPPYPGLSWLPFTDSALQGPDVLILIAFPAMALLKENCYDENEIFDANSQSSQNNRKSRQVRQACAWHGGKFHDGRRNPGIGDHGGKKD